jgi:hypothetical protein
VKLVDVLVHDAITNVFYLVSVEDQRRRLDRVRRKLSKFHRLGLAITVNRRFVIRDRLLGIIVEHEGEISGRDSSRPEINQCH